MGKEGIVRPRVIRALLSRLPLSLLAADFILHFTQLRIDPYFSETGISDILCSVTCEGSFACSWVLDSHGFRPVYSPGSCPGLV